GTIAGSNLTMIGAVKNAVRACGVALADAVAFATINPARLLGVDARKGSIAKEKDADIVIFDKDFDVKMTIVRGKIAYRKRGF
ncbi:MAG: amidohydrolase family protein, partial [Candidatus Omnitrophica bacterium]|nr:amidohydrolase family protein [Candidatus Omnitrophota bacterium]